MSKRSLVLVALFVIPLIALALFYSSSKHKLLTRPQAPAVSAPRNPKQFGIRRPAASVEMVRARIRARADQLKNMTATQYAEERKRLPNIPEDQKVYVKQMEAAYERLQKITPQQWQAMRERSLQERRRQQLLQRQRQQQQQQSVAPKAPLQSTPAPKAPAPAAAR